MTVTEAVTNIRVFTQNVRHCCSILTTSRLISVKAPSFHNKHKIWQSVRADGLSHVCERAYQSEPPCDVAAGRVTEAATWQQTAAHSGVLLYWKSVHCNWKMTHCIDHVPETSIRVIRSQQPGRRIWATDRWLLLIRVWRVTSICKLVVTNVTERSDKGEWEVEVCGRNVHMMNWKLQPQNFTINRLLYRSVDRIIILKCVMKKQGLGLRSRFIWHRTVSSGWLLVTQHWIARFKTGGEFN